MLLCAVLFVCLLLFVVIVVVVTVIGLAGFIQKEQFALGLFCLYKKKAKRR